MYDGPTGCILRSVCVLEVVSLAGIFRGLVIFDGVDHALAYTAGVVWERRRASSAVWQQGDRGNPGGGRGKLVVERASGGALLGEFIEYYCCGERCAGKG